MGYECTLKKMSRTNPGSWRLRMLWEHTHAKIAQN